MTSLFGKAPDSPEFVREGGFGEPEAMIESALLASVERGVAVEPARFLVAGPGYVRAGAWIESRDALGRAFPLALAQPLSEHSLLSIVPLHYAELLEVAEEALHARQQGTRGAPYLMPPHASLLLPRVHRTRAAFLNESARTFQLRALATLDGEALVYALSTVVQAAALAEPVALALPSALEDVLFAWMELLGALAPPHALSLIWRAAEQRAWLGWDMELTGLLARMHDAWPLTSEESGARQSARCYLGEDVCRAIERDGSMGSVLELLAHVVRYPHAG